MCYQNPVIELEKHSSHEIFHNTIFNVFKWEITDLLLYSQVEITPNLLK